MVKCKMYVPDRDSGMGTCVSCRFLKLKGRNEQLSSLLSMNLKVSNIGNKLTFVDANRSEVLDKLLTFITIGIQ